jgi:aminopeptidase N
MAGAKIFISSIQVDGVEAKYRRDAKNLFIQTAPLKKGKPIKITIAYSAKNSKAQPFGGIGGFHWIEVGKTENANRVGFWTQGETETNCEWAPTWDYPNDLATSSTKVTVQSDWDVVSNGVLVGTKTSTDKTRKTFHWKQTQPHATYLMTIVGGPLDIQRDKWQGVDLWYVVPKGMGYMIKDSFGNTKDMLDFFSTRLGVKYAWPKYAQNAMYDFGGGMENTSATTLGEGSLTEARDGYFRMDSLNSHELAHQWFGDLVTCKDWGDSWLNESFATYFEALYFEHSRGEVAFEWERADQLMAYLGEARRYKRPISTKLYPDGDAMFDSHTYPKGSLVLHSLRKMLGDEPFFAGLSAYLKQWRHTPVESAQLRRSMTEATGINVEAFWDQWFDKPGHPVLEYDWKHEGGELKLTVKQTQDTKNGTPIYNMPMKVDLIAKDGKHEIVTVPVTKAEETFTIKAASRPGAVVLDPEHDYLCEMSSKRWTDEELPTILRYGLFAPDRNEALRRIMQTPTSENVKVATEVVSADKGQHLTFRSMSSLAKAEGMDMYGFWLSRLDHVNFEARTSALDALSRMAPSPELTQKMRGFVNDKAPINMVTLAIATLAKWDRKGNEDVFKLALSIKDRRGRIKAAAERALKGQ